VSESTKSLHPLVKLDYIVRLIGCPIGAALVVSARVGQKTPAWMWIILVMYAFVWPHVPRAIAKWSEDSRRAEIRMLVVDATLGGFLIPMTSFRIVPTLAFALGYCSMLASVGGFRLLAIGASGMLTTCIATAALFTGFHVEPTGSVLNTILAGVMIFAFQLLLAIQTYWQARGFVQSRRRVAEQAEQILDQNRLLVTAREEALQAAQAKASFLATMSHEIRTPLNGVLGMTRLLAETNLTADQRDFVRTIQVSGSSLLAIINDILDYSKIESGNMEVEDEPLRLIEALEESFEIVAPRAREKGIELLYQIGPEVPRVIRGDITRLKQVLTNLVGNAVKFTEKGEVFVDVTLDRAEDEDNAAIIVFDVRDTGIGIPENRIGQLFSAFTQVDASTTRKYGGTGLGLAISKRLTQLMGGDIRVQSTLGKGSSFRFTVLARAADPALLATPDVDPVPVQDKRVLIVDDNPTNRRVLGEQLKAWGLAVESAEGGQQALALLAGQEFDLAILDLHMPDIDGLMLAERIKEQEKLQKLPLILLSSSVFQKKNDPNNYFAALMTKPIRQTKLFDALMIALSGKQDTTVKPQTLPGAKHLAAIAPLRILVADDNDVNRKLAGLILARFGYDADYAVNGRDAHDRVVHNAISGRAYDVILMDVNMPEMDGLEATRAIRKKASEHPDKKWPVIAAVTADAMQGDREVCLAAGMDDYLTKPLDFDAVEGVLERVAGLKAKTEPAATTAPAPAPPPPASADAMLMDWSRLDELKEYDTPDGEIVRDAVSSFVGQIPEKMKTMRLSIESSNAQGLRESAHSLKGAASNIGAAAVAKYASQLEKAGKDAAFDGTPELLNTLSAIVDQTVAEINGRYPGS
jgi:signal transduction histidine kinase/DNA-binding response OmpR family regulator/HPt (histidine-containing phosphotransfer) domain-containing protein